MKNKSKSSSFFVIFIFFCFISAIAIAWFLVSLRERDCSSPEISKSPSTVDHDLPIQDYKIMNNFKKIDIYKWKSEHPQSGGNTWFPASLIQTQDGRFQLSTGSQEWGHWLAPLGIRGRAHLFKYQKYESCRALVPDLLKDQDGKLQFQAFEVTHVVRDSPAYGHLQVGDLIYKWMDQEVMDSTEYKHSLKLTKKNEREIQFQAGEILDQASAFGRFSCSVIRPPLIESHTFEVNNSAKINIASSVSEEIFISTGSDIIISGLERSEVINSFYEKLAPIYGGNIFQITSQDQWRIPANAKIIIKPGVKKSIDIKCQGRAKIEISKFQLKKIGVSERELWHSPDLNRWCKEEQFTLRLDGNSGKLKLRVDSAVANNFTGCGLYWADVQLIVNGKLVLLSELAPIYMSTGYGSISTLQPGAVILPQRTVDRFGWIAHAESEFCWKLPPGVSQISGRFGGTGNGRLRASIRFKNESIPEDFFSDCIRNMTFSIPKTGQFSKSFPKECPKSDLLVSQTCEFLSAQQQNDGSWPCWSGYTTNSFHTAFCGLALMASGNNKYDAQIQKAAHYIGYNDSSSGWACPRGIILTFLAEYYLRYKDKSILPAIENSAQRMIDCVQPDMIAGHGLYGLGYNEGGQYLGAAYAQLGLSVASKCPINIDKKWTDKFFHHISHIQCNGAYPYGRGSASIRDNNFAKEGGNAMHGLGVIAAYLYNSKGSAQVVADARKRWDCVLGDGDHSHSTSSLGFFASSLAMNLVDPGLFRKHLDAFRWKFAIEPSFDGGWLKSSYIFDTQGGEGVTGLWIRSAVMAIILSSHKRNLIITGKAPQAELDKSLSCLEYEVFIKNFYSRNLSIAKQLLPHQLNQPLDDFRNEIIEIEDDAQMPQKIRSLITKNMPILTQYIASLQISGQIKSQVIELISGMDTVIEIGDSEMTIRARLPFQGLIFSSPEKSAEIKRVIGENFYMNIGLKTPSMSVIDRKISINNADIDWRNGQVSWVVKIPKHSDVENLEVTWNLFGFSGQTYRHIKMNKKYNRENLRSFTIMAHLGRMPMHATQCLVLDQMPYVAMFGEASPHNIKNQGMSSSFQPWPQHEGDLVKCKLSSSLLTCLQLLEVDVISDAVQEVAIDRIMPVAIKECPNLELLKIANNKSAVEIIKKSINEPIEIEIILKEKSTVNGMDFQWEGNPYQLLKISCFVAGKWIPVAWDSYVSAAGHHPTFYPIKTDRIRLQVTPSQSVRMYNIRPYYNPKLSQILVPARSIGNPTSN
ncbi:MAG: hypothetical protein RL095_3507 [Verrucomicrobiota bacterium]|jgi:hypothetical protein